jgi:hypothetical protein
MATINLNDVKRLGWRLAWGSAALAALPAAVGCQGKAADDEPKYATEGEKFSPDDEPRHVHRVLDAAAAAGARYDATLRGCHFDAGNPAALNSLGEEKLVLMLADDDALPLVVYIDVPADDLADARKAAVQTFLTDCKLKPDQAKVVVGRNDKTYGPAAPRQKAALAIDATPSAGSTSNASSPSATAK